MLIRETQNALGGVRTRQAETSKMSKPRVQSSNEYSEGTSDGEVGFAFLDVDLDDSSKRRGRNAERAHLNVQIALLAVIEGSAQNAKENVSALISHHKKGVLESPEIMLGRAFYKEHQALLTRYFQQIDGEMFGRFPLKLSTIETTGVPETLISLGVILGELGDILQYVAASRSIIFELLKIAKLQLSFPPRESIPFTERCSSVILGERETAFSAHRSSPLAATLLQ